MYDRPIVDMIDKIQDTYIGIENTVDCWLINLDDFTLKPYYDIQKCNSEYVVLKEKNQNIPLLRKQIYQHIICDYLKIPVWELHIARKSNGKPYIMTNTYKNVNFNVSHSKQYMLVGIKMNHHIGLDIQVIHSYHYIKDAYKAILSPYELKKYSELNLEEQKDYLFCTWVQKEAIAKALGIGLLLDFTTFRVSYFSSLGKFEYLCQEKSLGNSFKMSIMKNHLYFYAIAVKL